MSSWPGTASGGAAEDAGYGGEVLAPDGEHAAVVVAALHLDRAQVPGQHLGLVFPELGERGEVDGHGAVVAVLAAREIGNLSGTGRCWRSLANSTPTTRPRDLDHSRAMLGAVDPGGVRFQERTELTEPAAVGAPRSGHSPARAARSAHSGASRAAAGAPAPPPRPPRRRARPLDDRAVIDANHPTPYLDAQHPVVLLPLEADEQLGT